MRTDCAAFSPPASRAAISIYPGQHDVGAAVLEGCGRSLLFGGQAAVDQHRGNPRLQVHGPGFSKILIGDDLVDRWADYLDLLVESVITNGGRGCINASGIWASRHTEEIASAIAERVAAIQPLPPDHPEALLAAFTVPGAAAAIARAIEGDAALPGVVDVTARARGRGPHLQEGRADYLLPTVLHATRRNRRRRIAICFVRRRPRPEARWWPHRPTLGRTALTAIRHCAASFRCCQYRRLTFGPVPTTAPTGSSRTKATVEFPFRPRRFSRQRWV